jgi:amino acid transporter
MLAAPRLPYAMAEWGELPRVFASTHPRFHTPWVAILASSGIMLAFTLSSSFIGALTISTVIRLITYLAICLALPLLRRRSDVPAETFRVPGGPVVAPLALLACAWLLTSVSWQEVRVVLIATLAGFALYAMRGLRARRPA